MKKRKFSIILNISALCLCLAAVAIGVYSVKTAQLNITGTIGFQAHNCDVYVNGTLTGAATKNSDDTLTPTTLYYNTTAAAESTPTYKNVHDDKTGWAIGDLYFDDLNDVPDDKIAKDIVITIKMYNKAKYPVYAAFDASTLGIDVFQIKATAQKGTETAKDVLCVEMAANQTEADVTTLTITFTLKSEEFTKLTLTSTNPLLKFTKDRPALKGDLITMDLVKDAANAVETYRVLKTEGNTALVMAMFEASTSQKYWTENTTTTDEKGNEVTKYDGSDLDKYLNETWYDSLDKTKRAAIVTSNIAQYSYSSGYSSGTYNANTHASYANYSTKAAVGSAISRNVYALDLEDIEEYFGGPFSTTDIWTLFWNTTSAPSPETCLWLRSAHTGDTFVVWYVRGPLGNLWGSGVFDSATARPAFKIDLSKISYSFYAG